MTSEAIRDPVKDRLLTPQNSAFIIIDYQPVSGKFDRIMDRQLLVNNIVGTAKAAVAYGLPIIHSTVNARPAQQPPPTTPPKCSTSSRPTIARRSMPGGCRIPPGGREDWTQETDLDPLWTEACLTFPALDALAAGYEATRHRCGRRHLAAAHEAALRRIEQTGGKMISVPQLFCELQRDGPEGDGSAFVQSLYRDRRYGWHPILLRQRGSLSNIGGVQNRRWRASLRRDRTLR